MFSILQDKKECIVCHSQNNIHLHHIFFGAKNRNISDKNGFTCYLCYSHHEGDDGVHGKFGHELDIHLKQLCQARYEEKHSRDEFRQLIGKSYL